MTSQFVVLLPEPRIVYGPFDRKEDAQRFAAYLTEEVDPADVQTLRSPVADILAWREQIAKPALDRFAHLPCAVPEDCPFGPEPHDFMPPEGTGLCCTRQPWEAEAR